MIRQQPLSTMTDTLFPVTTLFRSLPIVFPLELAQRHPQQPDALLDGQQRREDRLAHREQARAVEDRRGDRPCPRNRPEIGVAQLQRHRPSARVALGGAIPDDGARSEEHTSELQSLMRTSYAVLCWKKKIPKTNTSDR